jgi:hypothetical protein
VEMEHPRRKYLVLIIASIIIVALIITSFFITTANATNWYVDKDATGSGTGTSWDNAWASFGAIVWNSVNGGDTIYISGGSVSKTYNEILIVGKSGTAGNLITISTGQDIGHTGTVIISGGSYARDVCVHIAGKSYIKLSGKVGNSRKMQLTGASAAGLDLEGDISYIEIEYLEINQNGNSKDTDGITGQIMYKSNYHSSIHDCDIHDNYQDGIHIVQSTQGEPSEYAAFLIYNNIIRNINDDGIEIGIGVDIYNNEIGPRLVSGGRGHPDGIQFYNSYTRIYNNYLHGFVITTDPGNSNSNIFCDPFDPDTTLNPKNIQVYNNLIVETATSSKGDYHRGISMKFAEPGILSANNILVANNTIVGIPFFGLSLTFLTSIGTANVSNVVIENNIFKNIGRNNPVVFILQTGNGTITYGSHGSGANVVVDYNLVYASSSIYKTGVSWNEITYTWSNYKVASGCEIHGVLADPSLNRAYRLNIGSPAVDKGVSLVSYFTMDKDGVSRPQDSAWDIGAFEGTVYSKKPQSAFDTQVR